MDSGAEYINVTFRGMEMVLNVTGKPIGAALRAIKVILCGIANVAKDQIDYARDKNGIKSATELKKLQYKRAIPVIGETSVNEIFDRYGSEFALLQIPQTTIEEFAKSVKEKGLCYAKVKDFNLDDGVMQIIIPAEQKAAYQTFFADLNKELMPEVDQKIKDYIQKITELGNKKNEINARIKFLMQQRLKEGISEDELQELDKEIKNYKGSISGIEREIEYVKELRDKIEMTKYSEIDADMYADTASGKSAEAFKRDGDLDTLECGSIAHYTSQGFEGVSFNNETEYLMNVGCADVYIERNKCVNAEGNNEYSYSLFDNGVAVGTKVRVTMNTSSEDINNFNNSVIEYVHKKNINLSSDNAYRPDEEDSLLFERINDVDVLGVKMRNFDKYVSEQKEKSPCSPNSSNLGISDEDLNLLKKQQNSDKRREDIDIRVNGLSVAIPVDRINIVENDHIILENGNNESMHIPAGEFKIIKNDGAEVEIIIAEPDKMRQVFSKKGEENTTLYETTFNKFGKTYADRFSELNKSVANSIEEIKKNVNTNNFAKEKK